MSRTAWPTWLVLLLVVMGGEFVVRGPLRFIEHGRSRATDFTAPYLGARALVRGLNPYSSRVFWDMATEVGWGDGRPASDADFESRTSYPPSALVLVAPVAGASWPTARIVTLATAVFVLLGAIGLVVRHPMLAGDRDRALLFAALALGLAPLHTALGTGNLSSVAVALTIAGGVLQMRGRSDVAGLCLGVAAGIKPPIAAPVLGYLLLRGGWRPILVAGATLALLTGLAAVRLSGVPWLADFVANNALLLSNSGVDVIAESPGQLQFVNLQLLTSTVSDDPRSVALLTWAVAGVLLLAWAMLVLRRRREPMRVIDLATAVVLSLLPIYHRVYDAGLLLLPLAWAIAPGGPDTRRFRITALICLAPFFVPGTTALELMLAAGRVPTTMSGTWWWRTLVLPHQVWALLVLSVVLLMAQAREARAA